MYRYPVVVNIVRSPGSGGNGLMCHFTFTLESMALMFICLFLHFRKVRQNHYLILQDLFELECLSSDFTILTVSKPVVTVGDIYMNFAALIFFFMAYMTKML